jgi:ubiquitin C-terminal hydrolase
MSSSLIPYNKSSALPPFGFNNLGATCYFNAVLQSLLSCTSFIDELLQKNNRNIYNKNPVAKLIIELIETAIYYEDLQTLKKFDKFTESVDDVSQKIINKFTESLDDPSIIATIVDTKAKLNNYSPQIWHQMVNNLCHVKKIPVQSFMQGQQCAGEGYNYLLESMEELNIIQNLFIHRYKSLIHCFTCDKWVSNVDCIYNIFDVEPNLQSEQIEQFRHYHIQTANMNEFLSKQTGYVDKDYICPECKGSGEKYRMTVLVMVPEILVVMSKKYTVDQKLDVYTEFPEQMVFKGNNNNMIYDAVAQIEHSGGKNGGHYWAICKRKNGWFNINDVTVTPSTFQPTKNTYIVFYHLNSQ